MKKEKSSFRREELEALSTQRLDQLLRAELDRDSPDEAAVLLILDVLKKREAGTPVDYTDAQAPWKAFQDSCRVVQDGLEPPVQKKRRSWIGRAAAAAAVVGLLILTVPTATGAEDLLTILGRWTQSIFAFFDLSGTTEPGDTYIFRTEHPGLQQIYDAVAEQGVTRPVVPTWVPEEYELTELKVIPFNTSTKIYTALKKSDSFITIIIDIYNKNIPTQYEKDNPDAAVYECKGILHYIVSNKGSWVAAWTADNLECSVTADTQEEILYEILDSIYAEGG